jgi:hypothetical protein
VADLASMKNPRVKRLLVISLIAGFGAALSTFAAGSHLQVGFHDGAFNFDYRVGTGESAVARVLFLISLVAGSLGVSPYVSAGSQPSRPAEFSAEGDEEGMRATS